ncbi:MAG: acyl--CoA ligase [Candidatus Heimdallarchaeota archaeon]|nr:MAG: acyl--CoA ligase [Candidatus Heimdallarchaeota archaeon]
MKNPAMDEECKKRYNELLPRMFDYVDHFSKVKGSEIALIEYDTGEEVTWKDFATKSKAFAAKLLSIGLRKGDIVATSLPLLKEHVYLMYACYRIGVIIAPLDLRLKAQEISRNFAKIKPKVYFFLGMTERADFRPMIAEVMKDHKYVCQYWVQFQKEADLIMEGAIGISDFIKGIKGTYIKSLITRKVKKAQKQVEKDDPCLIIFTTGSTGFPKPALLSHENILVQNIGLLVGFAMDEKDIMCVNLPPSHVGCTTEQLATTIYGGGISVILHIFDAEKTLDAVQKYNVTVLGQIPALFAMQWRLPNYNDYDISSLRFAIYGGQAVTRPFLEKLSTMAPEMGSGFGLTESAGFLTYTPHGGTVDDILASIGYDMLISPISIRDPMKQDGSAGDEKAPGEVGEICFSGPQVFLGYLGDEENTQKTISTDGYCYSGDLGSYGEKGLQFAGRAKFIIKPKGYNVFPTEVEDFVEQSFKGKVGTVACVGVPHEVFTEGIMAFVEKIEGQELSIAELDEAVKNIAAYKRPSHFEILKTGKIPLTRVGKTDYMILKKQGEEIAQKLRSEGKWDS